MDESKLPDIFRSLPPLYRFWLLMVIIAVLLVIGVFPDIGEHIVTFVHGLITTLLP